MSSNGKAIFVVGYGPGIAASVVELLAKQGYTNVGLVNRSGKLPSPVPEGVQRIEVAKADAADAHAVVAALDELKSKFGAPACVVHNVASVEMGPKDTLDLTPEELTKHYAISATSSLVTGQWTFKNIDKSASHKPMLFYTGGGFAHTPRPDHAGLGSGKAAQLNLVKQFYQIGKERGIHVAVITVYGRVSTDHPKWNPPAIAQKYTELLAESADTPDKWTMEVLY